MENTRIMNKIRVVVYLLLLMPFGQAMAAKTDVVTLVNGNAVAGEIESLEFGALKYKTDSMGTVSIEWEEIVSITSNQQLQVELTDGRRYFGNLSASDEQFNIKVVTQTDSIEFLTKDIVRITPIITEDQLWRRLEGDISFGFNAQKSSEVVTVNLASDIPLSNSRLPFGARA